MFSIGNKMSLVGPKFWWETLKVRDHSEDLGIDGKRILEWMLGG